MPSVKAKAKPAAKKPAAAPARTTAAPSKAAQAAAHQGRPEPEPRSATTATTMPAVRSQSTAVSPESVAHLPTFMRTDADLGKESIGKDDMEVPRLKLMQALSPELEAYDGLKPGDFFHPAAEHVFDEPFRVVPLFIDQRYILWKPRDSGGGILARADDGIHWSPSSGEFTVQLDKKDGGGTVKWTLADTVAKSGLANWGTLNPADPNSPPAATLMYNYLVAFPDFPDLLPAVLSFQRSSIKIGRRFNTKLKTVRAPIFGTMWTIKSVEDHNGAGNKFFNIDVSGAGLVEDEALYQAYKAGHATFSNKGLSIKDIEGLQDEPTSDDAAPAGSPDI